jgi:hypothetical protein
LYMTFEGCHLAQLCRKARRKIKSQLSLELRNGSSGYV